MKFQESPSKIYINLVDTLDILVTGLPSHGFERQYETKHCWGVEIENPVFCKFDTKKVCSRTRPKKTICGLLMYPRGTFIE